MRPIYPEAKYTVKKRKSIYIMLENVEIDWNWDDSEVKKFDRLYKQGLNAFELARVFNRPAEEIALMILDRAMQGFLKGAVS